MKLFYLTSFSISVLNIALMITVLNVFIWRIREKSDATRSLLWFLSGVAMVFWSFFYIFSSLDLTAVKLAWCLLHSVVLFVAFLVRFAYQFPTPHFEREGKWAFRIALVLALLTYAFYLWHVTYIQPAFDPAGGLFVFSGTYEIGVVVGLELLWVMAVLIRAARLLRKEQRSAGEEEELAVKNRIGAIRKLIAILFSPLILISAFVLAYLDLASWEMVGYLLGIGFIVFVYLFAVIYLTHATEPSSLQIKIVGFSLGAILILLSASSALTVDLHKDAFLSLKEADLTRNVELITSGRVRDLPPEVAYVTQDERLLYAVAGQAPDLKFASEPWQGGWLFRQAEVQYPDHFLIAKRLRIGEATYEIGYLYLLYRARIHELAFSLGLLVVGAALFVVLLFPLFFRSSVFGPLRRLLHGVRQVDRGDLDINIPVTAPDELGNLTRSFNRMAYSIRDSRARLQRAYEHQVDLTEAYSRFVPKQILSTLNKSSILELGLGDSVQKRMTILFSDIRSFTTISETLTPQEVFGFINRYLQRVGPIVRRHHGYIDKFIGDAIMALFPDGAETAVAAAIEMQREVQRLNGEGGEESQIQIRVGIGIHTGQLMLGTIGEPERMEGTVISDAVNLASRIEGLTKLYDAPILISAGTFEDLEETHDFQFRLLDRVRVKGKQQWADIIEILDGDTGSGQQRKLECKERFEQAVLAFKDQKFTQAQQLFSGLKQECADDRAIDVYLDRCRQFLEIGIPEDWDGAIKL